MRKLLMVVMLAGSILGSIFKPKAYERWFIGMDSASGFSYASANFPLYLGTNQNMGEIKRVDKIPDDLAKVNINLSEKRTIMSGKNNNRINCYPSEDKSQNTCVIASPDQKDGKYYNFAYKYVDADIYVKTHISPISRPEKKLRITYLPEGSISADPPNIIGLAPQSDFLKYALENEKKDVSFLMSGSIKSGAATGLPFIEFNPNIYPTWIDQEVPLSPKLPDGWGFEGSLSIPNMKIDLPDTLFCFSLHWTAIIIIPVKDINFCQSAIEAVCKGEPSCKRAAADFSRAPSIHLKTNNNEFAVIEPRQYLQGEMIDGRSCMVGTATNNLDCPENSVVLPQGFFDVKRVVFKTSNTEKPSIIFLKYYYIPNDFGLWFSLGALALAALLALKFKFGNQTLDTAQLSNRRVIVAIAFCLDWALVGALFYLGGQLDTLTDRMKLVFLSGLILILSSLRVICNSNSPKWLNVSLFITAYLLPCFAIPSETWIERTTTTYHNGDQTVSDRVVDNRGEQCFCCLLGLFIAFWSVVIGYCFFVVTDVFIFFQDFRKSMLMRKYSDRQETNNDFWTFMTQFSIFRLLILLVPGILRMMELLTDHPEVWILEKTRIMFVFGLMAAYFLFYGSVLKQGLTQRAVQDESEREVFLSA